MDDETRAAFAALTTQIAHGFAAADVRTTLLEERVTAGFARVDHYFELQQAQHLELRSELRALGERVDALTDRMDALTDRVARLEREAGQLRDFVTREIGEIRIELRELRTHPDQTDRIHREIAALSARLDRVEQRQRD